jgi:hypothetical protein
LQLRHHVFPASIRFSWRARKLLSGGPHGFQAKTSVNSHSTRMLRRLRKCPSATADYRSGLFAVTSSPCSLFR